MPVLKSPKCADVFCTESLNGLHCVIWGHRTHRHSIRCLRISDLIECGVDVCVRATIQRVVYTTVEFYSDRRTKATYLPKNASWYGGHAKDTFICSNQPLVGWVGVIVKVSQRVDLKPRPARSLRESAPENPTSFDEHSVVNQHKCDFIISRLFCVLCWFGSSAEQPSESGLIVCSQFHPVLVRLHFNAKSIATANLMS